MCNYLYIVQARMPPYSTVQYIPQLPALVWLRVSLICCAAISHRSKHTGKSPHSALHHQSYGKRREPPQIVSMPPWGWLFQMPLFSSSLMRYTMCGRVHVCECAYHPVAQVWMCKSGSQLPIEDHSLKARAFLEQGGEIKWVHQPCPSLALTQHSF